MRKINIAICEDDEKQLQINKYYIEQWANLKKQQVDIVTYNSSENFLFDWRYDIEIDIVFLDIKMRAMSGMELAQHIRKINQEITIIFITGEADYVFQGYEVQALNFLLKPINKESVFKCLDTWFQKNMKQESNYLVIKKGKEIIRINYNEIYYFTSFDHYVDIHTINGVITFKEKMGNLEQKLPEERFCRCHRSYIVNVSFINQILKNEILLGNEMRIPISKSRINKVYEIFLNSFQNLQ